MTSPRKRVAPADDPDRALIKGIAMDIGNEVAAYVECMYPEAVSATSSTFRLSLRNFIYNEIMAALEETDPNKILERLANRKKARRESRAQVKVIRETDWEHARDRPGDIHSKVDDVDAAVQREMAQTEDE